VIQPDGKAVIAGGDTDTACIARFNLDGTLDASFGTGGIRSISTAVNGPPALLLDRHDPLNRLIAVSWGFASISSPSPGGKLFRFLENGDNDPAFGDPLNNHVAATPTTALALSCASKIVGATVLNSGYPDRAGVVLVRFNSNGTPDTTFGASGTGQFFTALGDSNGVRTVLVRDDGDIIVVGNVHPADSSPSTLIALAYRQSDCVNPNDPQALPVLEYYNASLDHYFITSAIDDMNALDSGRFVGWSRTGYTFNSSNGSDGLASVCRFYIPPAYGDSHFFSASSAECAEVSARFPQFVLETTDAMKVGLPDSTTGLCSPPTSMPVYRVWDQRIDTNHRYTTDRIVRDAMVARGWIAEGYGPDAVAMCALPQ
jgi:hypothetical protein